MSRSRRLGATLAALAMFAALLGASSASAATVVNGGFETGTLEGWNVYSSNPFVEWVVVTEEEEEELLPPPFAVSEQNEPGTTILSQNISLEPGASHRLEMTFGYFSGAPIFIPTPDSLDTESTENQQVRVDVMKPTAPITSVDPSDILTTVFASSEAENPEGESPVLEPRRFSANLSPFAGQTVRLRIAVAVTRAPLFAFVKDVSVTSQPLLVTTLPAPAPAPPAPPSNVFAKGALTLNKKTGTGFLTVTVPGPGILTANDARRQIATALAAPVKAKKKPLLIKTATVTSAGAGTVKVPIKPTPAGMKVLKEKGKVAFNLKLTFAPTGGTPATQRYSGKLVKTLKPAPR